MSKNTFTKKVVENVYRNIKAIYYGDIEYLCIDENFELALCLAYMALSKEVIIGKDIQDQNENTRLTQKVPTEDMDDLIFHQENRPIIANPLDKSSMWYLDAIRDSIMHEKFEIDEENKMVSIYNEYGLKNFVAEIPFSWFIDYTRINIIHKKFTDQYSRQGFYYNKCRKIEKKYSVQKTIERDILYRVRVDGKHLNIKHLNNIIKETFERCGKYNNENYYESFELAKAEVEKEIKRIYPEASVDIYVEKKKNKILNKAKRYLHEWYKNYDYLHSDLNNLFNKRSTVVLDAFRDMFEYIDNDGKVDYKNIMKQINSEDISYSRQLEIRRNLFCVLLYTYGINSIVINKEKLFEDGNFDIENYALFSGIMIDEKECSQKRKILVDYLNIIDSERKAIKNYNACPENIKLERYNALMEIDDKMKKAEIKYYQSNQKILDIKSLRYEKSRHNRDSLLSKVSEGIEKYKRIELNVDKDKDKKASIEEEIAKCRNEIMDRYNQLLELETDKFCIRSNRYETIDTIRNSLSHVGRIGVLNTNQSKPDLIIFDDYKENNGQSGRVVCKLVDFISLLDEYINKEEEKPKIFTK